MQKPILHVCLCLAAIISLYTLLQSQFPTRRQLPDVAHITAHVAVERLEQVLFGLDSKLEVQAFLKKNSLFATQFLGLAAGSEEGELVERLWAMVHNPHIQALYREVQQVFGDCAALRQQFEAAFRHLRFYYPNFKIPQLVTFITGMGTDLYVSKELIVIGLDFFLGESAKFRPIDLPQYILRAYQPTDIVPKTLLLLSQQFIKTQAADQTLLADMLHYGKAYYFAQAMLPEVKAHTLLAYTPAQLADVEGHQNVVWAHFIEHELFYVTNHFTKNKYITDRPFVSEIGPRCPSNIGRWLGWEIIKQYMQNHPKVGLPDLMRNCDVRQLFSLARYRPR